jgi:hypothetical protein
VTLMTTYDLTMTLMTRHGRLEAAHYPDETIAMTYLDNGLVSSVSNAVGIVSNKYDGAILSGW